MTLLTAAPAHRSALPSASEAASASPSAILMVSMEPPAAMEDEFNDWYDTEHFPQRSALPGVQASSRWVCLEGWPRWMALYELRHVGVLHSDAYHAMSGANATPWSKRILPRTIGRTRVVAQQARTDPESASIVPSAQIARLLVMSVPLLFSGAPTDRAADHTGDAHSHIAERIGAVVYDTLSARPELLQLRTFLDTTQDKARVWLIAAFDAPVNQQSLMHDIGRPAGYGAQAFNLYAPYCRGG